MRIGCGDSLERLSNRLIEGLTRTSRFSPQAGLDLGPTFFNRGEIRCIGGQREETRPSGGYRLCHPRHFMSLQVVENHDLAGPQVGKQDVVEKGEKYRAIGEAFDGHRRHDALQA